MNAIRTWLTVMLGVAALALLGGSAGPARADDTVVLDAIASGHWSEFGEHHDDPSYLTGRQGGVRYVGFWVFDLSDLAGRTIVNARFNIWNPAAGFSSDIPTLRIRIRIPDALTADRFMTVTDGGPLHPEIFRSIWNGGAHQDLGYYYFDASDLDMNVLFRLPYRPTRLQAAVGGLLVLGADVSNTARGGADEYAFDGTGAYDTKQLILTVR